MNETMARAESVRLHAACAEALGGMVPDSQLAHHHETAGHYEKAARLFQDQAYLLREAGVPQTMVSMLRRALACAQRCKESAPMQELEMVLLHKLCTSWALSSTEMEACTARLCVLRDSGFGADLAVAGLEIALMSYVKVATWAFAIDCYGPCCPFSCCVVRTELCPCGAHSLKLASPSPRNSCAREAVNSGVTGGLGRLLIQSGRWLTARARPGVNVCCSSCGRRH